jgi:uncharacterized protein YprB with RNaseH-like and TPR domain/predicted RNA-binding Zn-ribbon protein involved in translation (DUF1610 family)
MKILAWDLECTSLTANWGTVLCGGVKEVGKSKVDLYSVADYKSYRTDTTNDKALVRDIRDRLSDADAWVTWYGAGYDVPMLNSRLLFHRLAPLPPIPHIDCWKTARFRLKLTSNRLAAVQGFFGLKTEKSPVEGTTWVKAIAGDRAALRYIEEHCRKDVIVLEEAYERIKPLIEAHPNRGIIDKKKNACPNCGKKALRPDRRVVSGQTIYQLYQCRSCGRWPRRPVGSFRGSIR